VRLTNLGENVWRVENGNCLGIHFERIYCNYLEGSSEAFATSSTAPAFNTVIHCVASYRKMESPTKFLFSYDSSAK
jgi:hypothetical protein